MNDLRRSTILFAQGQAADSIYFIENGLVKLTRTNSVGERIILTVRGANDLAGEELLSGPDSIYQSEAEVLTELSAVRIPKKALQSAMAHSAEWTGPLINYLVRLKEKLAKKVELLCLHDVEFRIVYYLGELSSLVRPLSTGESQIPITQLELADLIGATRETTSTTLNQLERRGLVKLSRRMMTVPSPERLHAETHKKAQETGTLVPPVSDHSTQPLQP